MFRTARCSVSDFTNMALTWQYRRGGRRPGFVDCYGMVQQFYTQVKGIDLPEIDYGFEPCGTLTDKEFRTNTAKLFHPVDSPKPGDIAGFKDCDGFVTHIGIWLGRGKVLHCGRHGIGILKKPRLPMEFYRYAESH